MPRRIGQTFGSRKQVAETLQKARRMGARGGANDPAMFGSFGAVVNL